MGERFSIMRYTYYIIAHSSKKSIHNYNGLSIHFQKQETCRKVSQINYCNCDNLIIGQNSQYTLNYDHAHKLHIFRVTITNLIVITHFLDINYLFYRSQINHFIDHNYSNS